MAEIHDRDRRRAGQMAEEFGRMFPAHGAEVWLYGDATGKKNRGQTGRSNSHVLMKAEGPRQLGIRMHVP